LHPRKRVVSSTRGGRCRSPPRHIPLKHWSCTGPVGRTARPPQQVERGEAVVCSGGCCSGWVGDLSRRGCLSQRLIPPRCSQRWHWLCTRTQRQRSGAFHSLQVHALLRRDSRAERRSGAERLALPRHGFVFLTRVSAPTTQLDGSQLQGLSHCYAIFVQLNLNALSNNTYEIPPRIRTWQMALRDMWVVRLRTSARGDYAMIRSCVRTPNSRTTFVA
jgi:hypothetical protein